MTSIEAESKIAFAAAAPVYGTIEGEFDGIEGALVSFVGKPVLLWGTSTIDDDAGTADDDGEMIDDGGLEVGDGVERFGTDEVSFDGTVQLEMPLAMPRSESTVTVKIASEDVSSATTASCRSPADGMLASMLPLPEDATVVEPSSLPLPSRRTTSRAPAVTDVIVKVRASLLCAPYLNDLPEASAEAAISSPDTSEFGPLFELSAAVRPRLSTRSMNAVCAFASLIVL